MKKTAFILSLAFAFFFVSCKPEKDVGPDLTTPLVGQYIGDYMIGGAGTGPQGITSSPTGLTLTKIQRKNNHEINITLIINDGSIQVNKRFDATVTIDPPEEGYSQPRPTKYRVAWELGTSILTLDKDGKLRGGFGYYEKEKQQMVTLSFGLR